MHKLRALLATFVLLTGLGMVAAAPASAHSTTDATICGSGYSWVEQLIKGAGVVTLFYNSAATDYCAVGFATGNDHGITHYQRVRISKNGNGYLPGDIDAGQYAHYAGPVNKSGTWADCIHYDYRWTDPQTGVTYITAMGAYGSTC
jgi:hypothetical protein